LSFRLGYPQEVQFRFHEKQDMMRGERQPLGEKAPTAEHFSPHAARKVASKVQAADQ
jgi:hypothetical protein